MQHACTSVKGELVRVEASHSLTRMATYYCMECGARALFRRGEINIPHFAHAPYDAKGNSCELRYAPADAVVEGGRFFSSATHSTPIREANVPLDSGPPNESSRAAHLKLWVSAHLGQGDAWKFEFKLGLPQLAIDTPNLEALHRLYLQVARNERSESQAWRLWPGQSDSLTSVPLQDRYELVIDPGWPQDPKWKKQALETAHIILHPEGNAFELEENSDHALLGILCPTPVSLLSGVRYLCLSRDPDPPPSEFHPVQLGAVNPGYLPWVFWILQIPSLDVLSQDGAAWLETRQWRLAQERTVRISSPPPVGFQGQIPVYPTGTRGWLLLETDPSLDPSQDQNAWLMNPPPLGAHFVIPDGRSPGKAICNAIPISWETVPHPQLVILRDGNPFKQITMYGRPIELIFSFEEARGMDLHFRSIIPLEVFVGPPGRLCPLVWNPEGRLRGLNEALLEAFRGKTSFQVVAMGSGHPRQVITFISGPIGPMRNRKERYHSALRRKSAWPKYAYLNSEEG